MDQIKAGDVVRLKGGGPLMTVATVGDELATVDWFDGAGGHHRQEFAVELLDRPAKPDAIGEYRRARADYLRCRADRATGLERERLLAESSLAGARSVTEVGH